jgi:hypothetical protein
MRNSTRRRNREVRILRDFGLGFEASKAEQQLQLRDLSIGIGVDGEFVLDIGRNHGSNHFHGGHRSVALVPAHQLLLNRWDFL